METGKPDSLKDQGSISLETAAATWNPSAIPLTIDEVIMGNVLQTGAAQAISCMRELNIEIDLPNQVGSAISIGHPIGCTGARQVVTGMHMMQRENKQHGLFSMCIGGGMGMAMIAERVG